MLDYEKEADVSSDGDGTDPGRITELQALSTGLLWAEMIVAALQGSDPAKCRTRSTAWTMSQTKELA